MSSAPVSAVLGYVRKLAAARKDDELPDHQLLERFALDRDEAAFAALLNRHGPMVLGVCRSVLHNLHDAEDAFQATFLVLARKANSIHRRETVSSWLHRVAYHLAVDAQADAARRRSFEKRAATMPSADPVLDLSVRELRRVLNEELRQLPEEYRAPLVLCCLEERSLEEAARLLGWTRWTVKGRLQRGRQRLRARLRRRGLELALGLFATLLSTRSVSAQVPAALVDSTLRAALKVAAGQGVVAGVVSAEVAALVQGASKTMFSGKAKIATVLLLAISVTAAVCGVMRHRAAAADQPAPQQRQADKPKAPEDQPPPGPQPKLGAEGTIEVRGRVLDPKGKPVAGAKLYLAKSTGLAWKGPAPSQQAVSGPDGCFQFAIARSELETGVAEKMQWPAQVMAVAEGHGCDWAKVGSAAEELTLRLVEDVPIRGRIFDPDGRPVVGAKLTMLRVWTTRGDDLGSALEAIRKGERYESVKDWTGPLPGQPAVLTTGADGRFRLTGVGRERLVQFKVEGPAIASTYLGTVMTRAAAKVTGLRMPIYGASFDYVGIASRPIRGVVRDQDTGKPLAGVHVEGGSKGGSDSKALTDQEGRYELLGLAKAPRYTLVVKPADGLTLQRRVELQDTPGLGALTGDVELVRGLTVRGRVTDQEGKPVGQARVEYHPLAPNPNVNARLAGPWRPCAEATTDPNGSYALTVLPGPGVIGVTGPKPDAYMPAGVTLAERKAFFKVPLDNVFNPVEDFLTTDAGGTSWDGLYQADFHALVLLEPGANEGALVKDVVLERPQERQGRVVGPDGQPLSGVTVFGLVRLGEETLKEAEFAVRGLNPRTNRQLVFYHKDKNLGFFVKEWRGEMPDPLTVKLQRCGSASGRVVDPDGQPVAGLRLDIVGMGLRFPSDQQVVTTDKEGRFRALGLVPGQVYRIDPVFAHVYVEPGQHEAMGNLKTRLDP
jgi:RNA polymerase sigma factor (sigma-70 family)